MTSFELPTPLCGSASVAAPLSDRTMPDIVEINQIEVDAAELIWAAGLFAQNGLEPRRMHLTELLALLRAHDSDATDARLCARALRACAMESILRSGSPIRAWVMFNDAEGIAYVQSSVVDLAARTPLSMYDSQNGLSPQLVVGFDREAFIGALMAAEAGRVGSA